MALRLLALSGKEVALLSADEFAATGHYLSPKSMQNNGLLINILGFWAIILPTFGVQVAHACFILSVQLRALNVFLELISLLSRIFLARVTSSGSEARSELRRRSCSGWIG